MLIWPTVAVLGFVVLAALVVALAQSSTARYEFERNQVQGQRQAAAVRTPVGAVAAVGGPGDPAPSAPAPEARLEPAALSALAHPAGKRSGADRTPPAWWLVDESADAGERAVDGPFHDRIEADWAVLAEGAETSRRVVYGALRADGGVVRRQSPAEQAWLTELGVHLDRLPEDWDQDLSDEDDDALVTLVVEVAAALVEAGLPVHDCAGNAPAGGVCLTPEPGRAGVLVSWHQHDRMSRDQVRGAEIDAAVQQTMNAAVTDCLRQMGFDAEPFGSSGCSLVTAAQWWW